MLYSEYQPTGFDPKGLACEDEQDWRVVPCGQTRDSDVLTRANFIAALEVLGGEGKDVKVVSFNHWACGWLEIILVNPTNEALIKEVDDIEACLADYPILDESKWSEMEWEAHCEWADQEIQRIANDKDIELKDSYCAGVVIQHFDAWYYDEYDSGSQPSDDDIAAFLIESGHGVVLN